MHGCLRSPTRAASLQLLPKGRDSNTQHVEHTKGRPHVSPFRDHFSNDDNNQRRHCFRGASQGFFRETVWGATLSAAWGAPCVSKCSEALRQHRAKGSGLPTPPGTRETSHKLPSMASPRLDKTPRHHHTAIQGQTLRVAKIRRPTARPRHDSPMSCRHIAFDAAVCWLVWPPDYAAEKGRQDGHGSGGQG
jgi:hypothetical protein